MSSPGGFFECARCGGVYPASHQACPHCGLILESAESIWPSVFSFVVQAVIVGFLGILLWALIVRRAWLIIGFFGAWYLLAHLADRRR